MQVDEIFSVGKVNATRRDRPDAADRRMAGMERDEYQLRIRHLQHHVDLRLALDERTLEHGVKFAFHAYAWTIGDEVSTSEHENPASGEYARGVTCEFAPTQRSSQHDCTVENRSSASRPRPVMKPVTL